MNLTELLAKGYSVSMRPVFLDGKLHVVSVQMWRADKKESMVAPRNALSEGLSTIHEKLKKAGDFDE